MALELGTTFNAAPDPLIHEANARDLPLIALHRETRFVESRGWHREIVNRQFAIMRRGDQMHRRFMQLMLDGAGIAETLASLSEIIANPVVLDRSPGGVLYHVTHHADASEVLAAWELVRHARAGAPEATVLPIPMCGGEMWGRLGAMALDSPLDEFDEVAVERAVALIALSLLRSHQEEVLAVRETGNFLSTSSWASGSTTPRQPAAPPRWVSSRKFMLAFAVVRTGPRTTDFGTDEAAWALVWRDVSSELRSARMPAIGGIRAGALDMLVVVGLANDERRAEVAGDVAATVNRAAERHFGAPGVVATAAGAAVVSWSDLRGELREAIDAAASAKPTVGREWQDATRPDLDRLLRGFGGTPELESFVHRRLGPVIEHDAARKAKLLPTLEAYCMHGGRKAETARALHMERQSLYHRLERIETLLGDHLDDEDTFLSVHLALRARRHLLHHGDESM